MNILLPSQVNTTKTIYGSLSGSTVASLDTFELFKVSNTSFVLSWINYYYINKIELIRNFI